MTAMPAIDPMRHPRLTGKPKRLFIDGKAHIGGYTMSGYGREGGCSTWKRI